VKDETKMLGPGHEFETTSWTLVRSVGDIDALDTLVRLYWKPLYFFVRQHGYPNESAKDFVQEFLTTMLEKGALSKADPERGRFRTFLLASMTNFLKDQAKSQARQKRGGGQNLFSLDFVRGEKEFSLQVAAGERPEDLMNRAWAKELWTQALADLRGSAPALEAFRLYLAGTPYPAISAQTGLTGEAAKMAVYRMKSQLREIVTGYIRQTVSNPDDLRGEMAHFIALLSKEGGDSAFRDEPAP
jgi:RNA polymerase sigma factor (sigma-70 family)